MSVPLCKVTPLQVCERPWYIGYGTAQEQRTLAVWSTTHRSTDNDREFMQSVPSVLKLQSADAYFKLRRQLQLKRWMLSAPH